MKSSHSVHKQILFYSNSYCSPISTIPTILGTQILKTWMFLPFSQYISLSDNYVTPHIGPLKIKNKAGTWVMLNENMRAS